MPRFCLPRVAGAGRPAGTLGAVDGDATSTQRDLRGPTRAPRSVAGPRWVASPGSSRHFLDWARLSRPSRSGSAARWSPSRCSAWACCWSSATCAAAHLRGPRAAAAGLGGGRGAALVGDAYAVDGVFGLLVAAIAAVAIARRRRERRRGPGRPGPRPLTASLSPRRRHPAGWRGGAGARGRRSPIAVAGHPLRAPGNRWAARWRLAVARRRDPWSAATPYDGWP